jgi:hypothetical protein
MTSDDFDWSPLGREFWLDTGKQLGASERQIKFAASKYRGTSNTRAAEESGYEASTEGGLRSTGYRLFRANVIQKLLAFASAESGGTGPDGSVDRAEARRILSSLARGSDPSVRIRSIEQLAKFDEADRQQRSSEVVPDPRAVAEEILRACPTMGAAVLADCHLGEAGKPWGMPFLKELSPIIRKDFPALWDRMRESITDQVQRLEFEAYANGPVLPIDAIIGLAPEPTKQQEATE